MLRTYVRSFQEPAHGTAVRHGQRFAQALEAAGDEGRHAVADRFEVARLAQSVRQAIDAAGLRQRQRERTRKEVIAPVQILFRRVRQRFAQRANQAVDHRIEGARHRFAAPRRRVVDLRDQREVVVPALVALRRALEDRLQERVDHAFRADRAAGFALVNVDRLDALAVDDLGAAREHRIEQAALGVEVVVQQRGVDLRVLRHFADRHAPETVARKMIFRSVEDALAHVGRSVVLQRPAAARPVLDGLGLTRVSLPWSGPVNFIG